MTRAPELLGVYEPTTPYSAAPDDFKPFAEGLRLVTRGEAEFVNRSKAIRLRSPSRPAPPPSKSGRSQTSLGPEDVEAHVGARDVSAKQRERIEGHLVSLRPFRRQAAKDGRS